MSSKSYQKIKLFREDLKGFDHDLELLDSDWIQSLPSDQLIGCVTEVHRAGVFVSPWSVERGVDFAQSWFCQIRGVFFKTHQTVHSVLVVGDRVLVKDLPHETQRSGLILSVFKRINYLFRESTLRVDRLQLLFANLDRLWGVFSCQNPSFRSIDLDRFLIWGEKSKVPVGLILTKNDLQKPDDSDFLDKITFYRRVVPHIFVLSIYDQDNENWDQLRRQLKNQVVAFYGESGVGKSSLINQLQSQTKQIVDEGNEGTCRKRYRYGRHTTTYSVMIPTDQGGAIVDSPGWRSFRLPFLTVGDLNHHYQEFDQQSCSFRDCQHDQEDGCGVPQGLKEGLILNWRYQNYLSLKRYAHAR